MKHRNLEKAVVLSLILSTGVYGSAWAADIEMGGKLWGELWNGYTEIQDGDNLVVTTDGVGIGYNGTVDVIDGNLTISSGGNGIESGYVENAQVNIFANNVIITSEQNGIFTELKEKKESIVTIGSEDRKIESLTITAGGQGIDNKNGNVYIYGAENSEFNIHSLNTSGDDLNQAAINNSCDGEIIINGGSINLTTEKVDRYYEIWPGIGDITTFTGDGITNDDGTTTLNFNNVRMNVTGSGIRNTGSGTVSLNTKGSNTIFARYTGTTTWVGYGVYSSGNDGTINVIASETYDPNKGYSTLNTQTGYNNVIYGQRGGIGSTTSGTKNIIADNNNFIGGGFAVNTESKHSTNNDTINIIAGNNNFIGRDMVDEYNNTYTTGTGIRLQEVKNVKVNVESIAGETTIDVDGNGIDIHGKGKNIAVTVKAGTDININAGNNGILVGNYGKDITNDDIKVELIAENGNNTVITNYTGNYGSGNGIHTAQGKVKLDAINNTVGLFKGKQSNEEGAIRTLEGGNVLLEADSTNTILANSTEITKLAEDDVFGDKYAINADREGTVDIKADVANNIIGAVYAKDNETAVNIQNLNKNATVANYIASSTIIHRAGDLDGKETIENPNGEIEVTGMDVISALYAQEGAKINLSGVNNILTYYDDPSDEHTSERAVWAYKGADITIEGNTVISTSSYESSPNDMDIAIAAGTSTNINDPIDMANVNLKYENYNGAKSFIQGDILAAYGGEVNIAPNTANTRAVSDAGINITGNLLAGNDGKLDVDLGNGGILVGRADDYGDAALNNGHGSGDKENGFYNPAFSSEIVRNGTVNLTMGEGSKWYVNGQSWITNVDTSKAQNTVIDLVSANTNLNMNSHALTIGTLKGDTTFRMKLDGNRQYSDMLYIGNGNGTYNIELDEVVTIDDMYADSGEGFKFSGLRFATVGKGSDVDFNVTATDKGFNNIIYTVGKDVYGSNVSNHENDAYNNGDGTSLDKPGNAAVEDLLKDAEQAGAATINTNDIMLLANEPDTGENLDNNENHLNYKLIDMQTVRSDAGETMLNMSRANYSNAIYMDRLNKRLGEARYINDDPEEDEGMWVRVRHDRIGKDEAFRSQNTMYELGYDKRQECDNGKRRVGFAVDYMHGDTGYNDIAGKGEIDRYGLWLYDTWTGNKGHYVDYVAKWGHLQNDFEVYNSEGKVTGDYSNNVFSISAEYGRKKDMGNDWYFEPQAQLQLARVTGADYTTSQGTKVSVDGINSLIGRAGFRIGKDFGEEKQSTLYFKADVLHEFLGDQTIRALDGTTNGWQSVDYENQGTWYDIGIGYAAMLSQSTYAFIDLEQSFGNDNDDTYQINAGVRWTF